jgi:two-component system response regulator
MLPDINFDIKQNYLEPGKILPKYTNSITEARSLNKEFFTDKRLKFLVSEAESSACKIIDSVSSKLLKYIGDADQFDDITMLALQRL